MHEMNNNENSFIGYEYKEITVEREMESVVADGYQNFGWIPEQAYAPVMGLTGSTMKFKRDRKIRNKMELTRLQRQFDACVNEIVGMERSKAASASVTSFTVGIIGTAFMAGSVFAIVATPPLVPLGIVLAIPAFIGWALPYFLYKMAYAKKAAKVTPLLDSKYDEIYAICERANGLL